MAASTIYLYYSVIVIHITDTPEFIMQRPAYATCKNILSMLKSEAKWFPDISNANTLWARIEACTSIIAACLPTLAPLAFDTKALHSLLDRWRSVFSRGSNSGVSNDKSWGEHREMLVSDSTGVQKGWQKLQSGSTTTASRDVELGHVSDTAQLGKGIVIQQTFRWKFAS